MASSVLSDTYGLGLLDASISPIELLVEPDMQRSNDTIGYAIRIGEEIEIRITSVNGEQHRVGIGASTDLFSNHQSICERIEAERSALAYCE